jgi:hypothetical protein
MAVTSIVGSQFTFKLGSTAYSEQVTGGGIDATPAIDRVKTLGGVAYPQTDVVDTASVEFLYDEETGAYGALWTASRTGAALSVEIVGGDAKWSGSCYATGVRLSYAADGVATASADLIGSLTLADAP